MAQRRKMRQLYPAGGVMQRRACLAPPGCPSCDDDVEGNAMRAVLALLLAPLVMAATYPADVEAVYAARFQDIATSKRGELSKYDPLQVVPGAKAKPLPVAATSAISKEAIEAAAAYAGANNSNAFMIIHKGEVVAERYFGGADATTGIVSKSLAKPITALAVGRAIMLGKIKSLDQPVSDFIPEWKGTPKDRMLIRHLLDMRSGLLAQGVSAAPDNIWSRAYLHPYHERIILEEYPLTDAPGSIYEYSNATSELIALIIERATGRRYAEFIGNEVLKPIGAPGGKVWINRDKGLAHSGCCALLPAESFARMAMLVMNDGVWQGKRLLPKGFVADMKTGTAQNPHYGLGLWLGGDYVERRGFANPNRPMPKVLHSEPFASNDVVMFDGNSNQIVYIVPSQQLVVLRTGDAPPRSPEWDNTKLINTVLRGIEGAKLVPQPKP
jgi:CubicO group peptidase (beta-lactamase class C family)